MHLLNYSFIIFLFVCIFFLRKCSPISPVAIDHINCHNVTLQDCSSPFCCSIAMSRVFSTVTKMIRELSKIVQEQTVDLSSIKSTIGNFNECFKMQKVTPCSQTVYTLNGNVCKDAIGVHLNGTALNQTQCFQKFFSQSIESNKTISDECGNDCGIIGRSLQDECDGKASITPCGEPIKSSFGSLCEGKGIGINYQQCLSKVFDTSHNEFVRDSCNNNCKIKGFNITQTTEDINNLKLSVPNQNGNELLPPGSIIMWSGSIIPNGWGLCNGSRYQKIDRTGEIESPNLVDRFIVGSGGKYNVGNVGGAEEVKLTQGQMPSHNHEKGTINVHEGHTGDHSHMIPTQFGGYHQVFDYWIAAGNGGTTGSKKSSSSDGSGHTHKLSVTGSTGNRGSDLSHENRPPYYSLAYIIKL